MTPPQLAAVAGERPRAFLLTPHGAAAATFFVFGIGVGLWSGASATILAHAGVTAAPGSRTVTHQKAFPRSAAVCRDAMRGPVSCRWT